MQRLNRRPNKQNRFFNIFYAFPLVFIFFIISVGLIFSEVLVSVPANAQGIQQTRLTILLLSIFFSALILVINFFLKKRITKPVAEILEVAEALRTGDYSKKIKYTPKNELGFLGETLNHLGEQISSQITRISREKAQLKTMLTGMIEGVISVDDQLKIQFCNRAAYQILGIPHDDFRGMTLNKSFHMIELTELAQKALQTRELVDREIKLQIGNKKATIEAYATSYHKNNDSGVIIVLNDITQVIELERVRTDFVANVSHEIKTPLTSILGYAETLLDGAIDDAPINRRFVKKIEENSQQLHNLVRDLLSLAQIETSNGDYLRVAPTDWVPVIKHVLQTNEDNFRKNNISVKLEGISNQIIVLGEKQAMMQILNNLVTNAVRYSHEGSEILIKYYVDQKQGILEVSDTGLGIPEKDIDRIFERFYRVDKARSRQLGGTGLGLSIVKHLIGKLNGKISVDSSLGRGSAFKVALTSIKHS